MGNQQGGRRASRTSLAPHLDETDLQFLVRETQLSSGEVLEYYDRFCSASHGRQAINCQTFSEIMHKCYPRTYKVNTSSCQHTPHHCIDKVKILGLKLDFN